MNEELRTTIEEMKEQQAVTIDLEWYQGTAKLDEVKQFIRANINSVSRSFVAIGYYLKYIRDNQLFTEDGYQNIWEFAQVEFGISKPQASKLMAINDKFSKNGNSPVLVDQYKDFSSSKLSEMLYLTDEQLDQVAITTTIAEIREIKNPEKAVSTSKQEPDQDPYSMMKPEVGALIYAVGGDGKISKLEVVSKNSSFSPKYFDAKDNLGQVYNLSCESEHWHLTRDEAKNDPWYDNKQDRFKSEKVVTVDGTVDNQPDFVDNMDNQQSPDDLSLDCYNQEEGWHKENISSEPDSVETVEADIIETLSTETKSPDIPIPSHLELAKEMLKQKQERLNDFIRVQADTYADRKYIESRKVEVAALASYITDLDNIVNPIPEPVQPELPILKNNDQRKEFIDAYETWPIWIDLKETGERYYRYDLTDKVAMVVKVSWKHAYAGYRETKDYEYGAEQYYLIGVKSEWSATRSQYIEDASRTFYECSSNKSALVEYLKDFQKRGA